MEWGSLLLLGASLLGCDRGCSRWPWFRADLDRISLPSLCVLAGAVGHPCIVLRFGRRMDARRIAIVLCAYGGPLCMMRGSAVAALVM